MQFRKDRTSGEWVITVVQILLILVILALIWKIGNYLMDAYKSNDFSKDLQQSVIIMEEKQPQNAVATQENTEETGEAIPVAIDFDSLHEVSEDAIAWIYDPGRTINYVVAQTGDNDYYLHHMLDGRTANSGTIFVDCRNNDDFSDWNTIMYGHNMKNGTMFASLLDYRNPGYYKEHPVMYLYTPGQRYRLELVAGYTTGVDDAIYSFPDTESEREEIINHVYRMSDFSSGVTVEDTDRLVTLSTCAYEFENARYVVIARLVED